MASVKLQVLDGFTYTENKVMTKHLTIPWDIAEPAEVNVNSARPSQSIDVRLDLPLSRNMFCLLFA